MRRRWCNWSADAGQLRKVFDECKAQNKGDVRIYTVLDHVSSSGMMRVISAFVPVVRDGHAEIACVAREKEVSGCGMDMGFHLAYNLFCEAYGGTDYNCLQHQWL